MFEFSGIILIQNFWELCMSVFYYGLWKKMTESGVTQKELVDKCKISTLTFSRMKAGECVSFDVISRLCDYFNCDYGDIITRYENPDKDLGVFGTNRNDNVFDILRTALLKYMEANKYRVSDISIKSFIAVNTIKSFIAGNGISSITAMKLMNLGEQFANVFKEELNKSKSNDNAYTIQTIEEHSCQECLKCMFLDSNVICDVVPSVKYDKNGVNIKYDNYYKTFYCKKGCAIVLDENKEPRPKCDCFFEDKRNQSDGSSVEKNRIVIKAKPAYLIHEEEYINLLCQVPNGYVTRDDDIIDYFKRKYNVTNIEIIWDMPAYKKDYSKIPYWRVISTRGMLMDTLFYSKETQKAMLEKEGHYIITCGVKGKSLGVKDYKVRLYRFS